MKIFAEYTKCSHSQIVVVSCVDRFNKYVLDENSCLYYLGLLPPPRIDEHRILRHQNNFQPPRARTTRYNKSFILYALNDYQSNSWKK